MTRRFFAATILLLSLVSLHADLTTESSGKKKPRAATEDTTKPTALAIAQNVEVERGGEMTIDLRGVAAGGGTLEFRLVRRPQHGKIIRSTQIGDDQWEITYRHSGDRRADEDSFVFAVRSTGLGPFSPGEVKIKITDRPAALTGPDDLEFSTIEIGQTDTQRLVVSNEGGEPTGGTLEASSPWQIQGKTDFHLNPGAHLAVTLLFTPDSPGKIQGSLRIQGDSVLEIPLSGIALAPFSVSPGKIALQPAADGSRVGIFLVQNNTSHAVPVHLDSDLEVPADFLLKFGEAREITVKAKDAGSVDTGIQLTSGSFTTRITVEAPPTPAQIEAVPGPDLNLGEIAPNQSISLSVHLRNRGGVPASLEIGSSKNLQISENSLGIESEGEAELPLQLLTPKNGDFRETLTLNYAAKTVTLTIHGTVSGETPVSANSSNPANSSPAATPVTGGSIAKPITPKALNDPNAWLFSPNVTDKQKKSLRLRWLPLPGPVRWNYAVEYRHLRLNAQNHLEPEWRPIPELTIQTVNGSCETLVTGLAPGIPWTFRVIATPADGSTPWISAPVTAQTLPPLRLGLDWRWLLLIAFSFLAFKVIRQRWSQRGIDGF